MRIKKFLNGKIVKGEAVHRQQTAYGIGMNPDQDIHLFIIIPAKQNILPQQGHKKGVNNETY